MKQNFNNLIDGKIQQLKAENDEKINSLEEEIKKVNIWKIELFKEYFSLRWWPIILYWILKMKIELKN